MVRRRLRAGAGRRAAAPGLLGDRVGRRRVLLGALALFGAGSLACAYAPTSGLFIAARLGLGLAAAGLTTMSLAVLPVLFAEAERPRAVGIWAGANFIALPIGPLLGGWLLTHFGWGAVFLINVPVVVIALVAVAALLPESRSPEPPGLDGLGVILSSGGLAAIIYGISRRDSRVGSPRRTGAAGCGRGHAGRVRVVGAPADGAPRRPTPGGPGPVAPAGLHLGAPAGRHRHLPAVRRHVRAGAVLAGGAGRRRQAAGVRLLPVIGGLVVGAGGADRLAARLGAKWTSALGFLVVAGGMAAGATTTVSSGDGFVAAWTAFAGAGTGLALATAANAALGALTGERSGVGSALMQAVQKVGAPFAVAILGAVLNAGYRDHLALAGLPARRQRGYRRASTVGWPSPGNWARRGWPIRCAAPSPPAWPTRCGSARASQWARSCSRWPSCQATRPPLARRAPKV